MIDRLLHRRHDLLLTECGDDLLAYDPETHALHTLNRTLAQVFRRCDGTATIENLVQGTGLGEDEVRLAVDHLYEARLMQGEAPTVLRTTGSRRRFLRKVGIAASVPAITSVTMPMATAAASVTCTPSGEPCSLGNPAACCSFVCTNFSPPNPPVCA